MSWDEARQTIERDVTRFPALRDLEALAILWAYVEFFQRRNDPEAFRFSVDLYRPLRERIRAARANWDNDTAINYTLRIRRFIQMLDGPIQQAAQASGTTVQQAIINVLDQVVAFVHTQFDFPMNV